MINTIHYVLKTVSTTGELVNASVMYDVYYDRTRGISYEVDLEGIAEENGTALERLWKARIVNQIDGLRLEYDYLKRFFYQSAQTIKVESALTDLQEDLEMFLQSSGGAAVANYTIENRSYPGKKLNTLTIWYDPDRMLPIRRENLDRDHLVVDEFTYYLVNQPLAPGLFILTKPSDVVSDFDMYPEPQYLPRFDVVPDANSPQYGVYVETLLKELRRFVSQNQWEYGPFATLKLPWLTRMPVTIYRGKTSAVAPPLTVVVDAPGQGRTYFSVSYDFLGYVVVGFTQNPLDLSNYELLPITASIIFEELAPLYQAPSYEKEFVIHNFVNSVQSNDYFINAFAMGDKLFDLTIKNFSFHENEGYLLLDVYGKEYWDNANIESMFNFVVTGQMADAHVTPIVIYAINSMKRLGIYREVLMPSYPNLPIERPPQE